MPRWSARSGQIEPVAALAGVCVVAVALAVYAGAFEASLPGPASRSVADPTADRIERAVTVGGVVRPERLADLTSAVPEGYATNVTLVTDDSRWTAGPAAPATADGASRRVSVRRSAASVVPGRLEVRVWS